MWSNMASRCHLNTDSDGVRNGILRSTQLDRSKLSANRPPTLSNVTGSRGSHDMMGEPTRYKPGALAAVPRDEPKKKIEINSPLGNLFERFLKPCKPMYV